MNLSLNGSEKRSGKSRGISLDAGKTSEPAKGFSPIRMRVMGAFLALLFMVACGKAIHIHVVMGDSLREKAARQVDRTVTLRGKRGRILDRAGKEIARSADALSVGVYPGQVKETEPVANSLASTLKLDPVRLQMDLIAPRPFVWVKRQVTPKEASAVRELKLTGVDFVSETCRYYPKGTCAAQLIGLTGIDGVGLEGLEHQYDHFLAGGEKRLSVRQDALGNRFEISQEEDPADFSGNDLVLTIDLTIQFIVEDALSEAVKKVGATSGMAVVMQPNTGAILAMANVPLFNPNAYTRFDRKLWRNRVITDAFEPGSTMKIFSAAAAVEAGGMYAGYDFFLRKRQIPDRRERHSRHQTPWLASAQGYREVFEQYRGHQGQ